MSFNKLFLALARQQFPIHSVANLIPLISSFRVVFYCHEKTAYHEEAFTTFASTLFFLDSNEISGSLK